MASVIIFFNIYNCLNDTSYLISLLCYLYVCLCFLIALIFNCYVSTQMKKKRIELNYYYLRGKLLGPAGVQVLSRLICRI